MNVKLGKGNRERRSPCAETERRKAEGMAAGREKAREKRVKRTRTLFWTGQLSAAKRSGLPTARSIAGAARTRWLWNSMMAAITATVYSHAARVFCIL